MKNATSTDTAKDGWIAMSKRPPAKGQRSNALGLEVLIWPRFGGDATAYYGKRFSIEANFYKYGALILGVTHWMPLPKGPSRGR